MIECLQSAERECTSEVDVCPGKILRPIGTTFKEWSEDMSSTDLPCWVYWRIIGYGKTFKGRRGGVLLYERHEEIENIESYEEKDNG